MRIWAEAWDATQTQCFGAVNLTSATVQRRLDGMGSFEIGINAGDPTAECLQAGRWVSLYSMEPYGTTKRLIEWGVLQKMKLTVGNGAKVAWQGNDATMALQQVSTYRGLVYLNQPIKTVVRDLVKRVSGWAVTFDDGAEGLYTTQRFDGVSILKAISKIAETHGLHWRLVSGSRQLQFGKLGRTVALRASDARSGDEAIKANSEVALIESLSHTLTQADLLTRLEAISGPADGALTLRFASKSDPYPVQTMTRNGRAVYYLEDSAAVAEYGVIEAVASPSSLIVPISTTTFEDVANTLYDWGATYLRRRAQPQRVYDCKLTKVAKPVRPGDWVQVDFDGDVEQGDQTATYADIHDVLWVIKSSERYGDDGLEVSLQLSNIDDEAPDAVSVLARTVKAVEESRQAVAVSINSNEVTADLTMSGSSQVVTVPIANRAIGVTSCQVTLTRDTVTGPGEVGLHWDGVEIGGAWLSGTTLSETVDIVETVLNGSITGDHSLTVYAAANVGLLHVRVNVYSVIAGADSL